MLMYKEEKKTGKTESQVPNMNDCLSVCAFHPLLPTPGDEEGVVPILACAAQTRCSVVLIPEQRGSCGDILAAFNRLWQRESRNIARRPAVLLCSAWMAASLICHRKANSYRYGSTFNIIIVIVKPMIAGCIVLPMQGRALPRPRADLYKKLLEM